MASKGKKHSTQPPGPTSSSPSTTPSPAPTPAAPQQASAWLRGKPTVAPAAAAAPSTSLSSSAPTTTSAAPSSADSTSPSTSSSSSLPSSSSSSIPAANGSATSPSSAPSVAIPSTPSPASAFSSSSAPSISASAAPSTVSGSSASSPPSSESSILSTGNLVRVTDVFGAPLEGVVWSYDPTFSLLALEQDNGHKKDFILFNTKQIKYELLTRGYSSAKPSLAELDTEGLKIKEAKEIDVRIGEASKIKEGATPEAQRIFDVIAKTLPCHWDGLTIVVLGSTRISPPYTPASCSGSNAQQVSRIKSMVEKERKKIGNK